MAHGNASDLAFLLLLIGAIITWAKPDLLFKPSFPLADEGIAGMVTLSGGLAFLFGMMLSGVKWNPVNGKMGGFGGFCAAANAVLLGTRNDAAQIFFLAFGAALALGSVHIFFFPSNPPVPKGPDTKNNHGNVSDLVMLLLFIGSMACIFYPDVYFRDVGPIKASFAPSHREELEVMLSYCGGLLFTVSMVFSGVKWNPINGKMAGFGCFVCAGLALYVGTGTFYFYFAAVLLLGGVHIFVFPSNPLLPKVKA
jgi:hypothetical protein